MTKHFYDLGGPKARYSRIGDANLSSLDEAHNFTKWLYEEIRPYAHGAILEVGSGTGTYSRSLLRDFPHERIALSDIDADYVRNLATAYGSERVSAHLIDLGEPDHFAGLQRRFDTVIALNVLEHVQDDVRALKNVLDTLRPGGTLILLVPAHQVLYNRIDEAIGHYRRYAKNDLLEKVRAAGFTVDRIFYFNALSIFGWYLNGNVLKKTDVGGGLLSLYNRIVPVVRIIERLILRRKIGISLIAILQKT